MTVLLLHLDGKLPNLALMRLAAYHRDRGDDVTLRIACNPRSLQPRLDDPVWHRVYGSLIFARTVALAEEARRIYPGVVLGGTGWSLKGTLGDLGVGAGRLDYSDYPTWRQSIGFTQRGCRLRCSFCVVPQKEGAVVEAQTIADIWRGEPWPRELLLLDNDFFGHPRWPARIEEIRDGCFRVSFNQGINARTLTDETAAAIASVDYRDDSMRQRRIYTAWDNRRDEQRLFAGLESLVRHGVKPRHVMVYMLIGYWKRCRACGREVGSEATECPNARYLPMQGDPASAARKAIEFRDHVQAGFEPETHEDREHRRRRIREFGALPYPMPYARTPELLGFQRWVIGGYDKAIPWAEWSAAHCQPRNLTRRDEPRRLLRIEAAS